ncbi:MAG: NUDIX domain-containing protein [Streptosporangiales bacterium]
MTGHEQVEDLVIPGGTTLWQGEIVDEPSSLPVGAREVPFRGKVWDVHRDTVGLGAAGEVVRDYITHPGAVGILALDERERVLLVRQYRHPVGAFLFEPPAGLRDMDGETLLEVGRRELYEETGYEADDWCTLVDVRMSPGASAERLRMLLARGVRPIAAGRPEDLHGEEVGMPIAWVPLAEIVGKILAGDLHSPTLVHGALAAWAARADGYASLRPADAPER